MAGSRQSDERKTLFTAQLGEEDAVRFHAQAGLHKRLGRYTRGALSVLAVEEVHHVRVVRQGELGRVLDRDQPLVLRHLLDQAFHEGGFARAGFAADHDGLVVAHGQAQELGVTSCRFQVDQLLLKRPRALVGRAAVLAVVFAEAIEQPVAFEIAQPQNQLGRFAHRDRDRAAWHRRRNGELDALTAGERGREQGAFLVDLLVAERGHGSGQGQATLLRHLGGGNSVPAAHRLHLEFTGPVHTDLQHPRRIKLLAQRAQKLDHRGGVTAPALEEPFLIVGQGGHRATGLSS